MTALQEMTPRGFQARVTGLLESLAAAMPGVGYVLGGVLASIGSPRTAYAVAGGGVLALVLLAIAVRPRMATRSTIRLGPPDLPLPEPLSPAPTLEHDRS
jgi:MFS family permease